MAQPRAPAYIGGSATIHLLREFSVPLIAGVLAAMVWANVSPPTYAKLVYNPIVASLNLEFLANELFMTIFFGIAAVEITDALVPGGSLNPPRKAVAPLLATAGGVLGPVAIYFLLNKLIGGPQLARGWGIGTATDIALAWLVARGVFGKDHPAISFLLLLAIAADAIGLVIIAILYPDPKNPQDVSQLWLVLVGVALGAALRWRRMTNYWPYLLLAGTVVWTGLYRAHLHPALALVFVVPFMPHAREPEQATVFDVPEQRRSTLISFEHDWKLIVDFGLFFFGLANAGVQFSEVGTVTWLVLASLVIGKPIGIFGLGLLARSVGFPLPSGMNAWALLLLGLIAGIGLTVALFMSSAAFADPHIQSAAKMGALGSVLVAPLALLLKQLRRPAVVG